MRLRACTALLCCVFAGVAGAQKSATEVTDAQIREYKTTAENACIDSGKASGDPVAKVTEFCKCMTGVFEKSLTRGDWQQLYFLATQQREAAEANILGPHMSKLRACRPPAPAA